MVKHDRCVLLRAGFQWEVPGESGDWASFGMHSSISSSYSVSGSLIDD